jgi:hypothetical protein
MACEHYTPISAWPCGKHSGVQTSGCPSQSTGCSSDTARPGGRASAEGSGSRGDLLTPWSRRSGITRWASFIRHGVELILRYRSAGLRSLLYQHFIMCWIESSVYNVQYQTCHSLESANLSRHVRVISRRRGAMQTVQAACCMPTS